MMSAIDMTGFYLRLSFVVLLAGGCKGKPMEPAQNTREDSAVKAAKAVKANQPDAEKGQTSVAKETDLRPVIRPVDPFLVTPGKVGAFENGMNVNEVYSIAPPDGIKLVDLFSEGMFAPAFEIRLAANQKDPSLVVSVWSACSRFSVYGISVRDARYRTREGLGVGSTLGELRRYFKVDPPFEISETGDLSAITPGLTFALEYSDSPKDDTKVKSIWVYPDEEQIEKRWCPQTQTLLPGK